MIEFKLPSLGADMDEGKLLEWKVQPGDAVRRGDVVAIVDTSKAAVDLEIWDTGTMHELVAKPGETVPVGAVLARLLAPGESAPTAPMVRPAAAATASAPAERLAKAPAQVPAPPPAATPAPPPGAPLKAKSAQQKPLEQEPEREKREAAAPARAAPTARLGGIGRLRVSPAARVRAEALGLRLDGVAGTGADGAITLQDVENAAALLARAMERGAAPEPALPATRSPEKGAEPASPAAGAAAVPVAADKTAAMRRAIASAMSRSKREIPHYYLAEVIPLRRAVDWLNTENGQRPMTERILMAALLIKAVARACQAYPDLNGHYVEGEFRPSEAVHVGVAIALRQGGLVAPAILSVERKSVGEVMKDLADLVRRARIGSLRSSELASPTITVTHLGDQGVDAVFGVIYPPQVALVGFGRVADRALVEAGGIFVVPTTTASLSADHRVSDGHRGALFLAEVRRVLQEPEGL